MFKDRRDAKTTVSFTGGDPIIYVDPLALDKMAYYVQGCDKEIGWLGKVRREDNLFLIEDVYLFKQEVHCATCEITPEGLTDFVTDMYVNHSDIADDVLNNLRLWGHSHVNMSVSPSAQDETQINTFKEANPWFIRVIANKSGEMEFCIYDFAQGIKFTNVKWMEYRESTVALAEAIKAEIAEKVTTKTYATVVNSGVGRSWNYKEGKWVNEENTYNGHSYEPQKDAKDARKKNSTKNSPRRSSWKDETDYYYEELYGHCENGYKAVKREKDGSISIDFIENQFTETEIKVIASCETIGQVEKVLDNIDIVNIYSTLDVMNIFDYAQNKYPQ